MLAAFDTTNATAVDSVWSIVTNTDAIAVNQGALSPLFTLCVCVCVCVCVVAALRKKFCEAANNNISVKAQSLGVFDFHSHNVCVLQLGSALVGTSTRHPGQRRRTSCLRHRRLLAPHK
jgi:hypothetical protein